MTGANIVNIEFMKKTPEEILSEIKELARDLSLRLKVLENKYVELEQSLAAKECADTLFEPVAEEDDTIDIDLEIGDMSDDVMPSDALSEKAPEPALPEECPEEGSGDKEENRAAPVAVLDAMAEKQAWRKDIPGTEVKDVRSAISLNDRILFIRSLFADDALLFQNTLDRINSSETLDEAVDWLMSSFGEWNFESDTVYRFMMAVRRKLK